jgi:flagellar basal-body rod protein FlgB
MASILHNGCRKDKMAIDYQLIDTLKKDLSIRVKKNELIAANIANIDTPGYKSKNIQFKNVLKNEIGVLNMKVTDSMHIKGNDSGNDYIILENTNPGRVDGNNVNVEKEMLDLTRNNIRYNIAVQFLAKELAHLKQAIMTEGK